MSEQFYTYGTLIGAREQDCMYVAKMEINPMLPPLEFPITRHMFETLRNGDRFKIVFKPIEK